MVLAQRGITFIELMVAATMVSVLVVGFSSHLRGGVIVWQRATETSEERQRQWIALDRLERDLTCAIRDDHGLSGDASAAVPSVGFGMEVSQWYALVPIKSQPWVQFVRYACESHDGVPGLWRMSQSAAEARADQKPLIQLLLPGCERLGFRYAYLPQEADRPFVWFAQWDRAQEALPRLVEVTIQLAGGQQLRRIYAIPVGILKPLDTPDGSP